MRYALFIHFVLHSFLSKKHIQKMEPEDDYLWLLRRKTASPIKSPKARTNMWPFRNMDCLRANRRRSLHDDSLMAATTTTTTLGSRFESDRIGYRNQRAVVNDENSEMMMPRPDPVPMDYVEQAGSSNATGPPKKQVSFQLPASYYKRC